MPRRHRALCPVWPGVNFYLDPRPLWERARPIQWGEMEARIPAPEDLLLTLSLHNFRHGFEALLGYCDIAEVVRTWGQELDWRALADRCAESGATSVVGYHLAWVQANLGVDVPSFFSHLFEPEKVMERGWFRALDGGPIPDDRLISNHLAHLIRQIRFIPGRRNRLHFAFRSLFPPQTDFSRHHPIGPSRRRYILFLFRPIRFRRALQQWSAVTRRILLPSIRGER